MRWAYVSFVLGMLLRLILSFWYAKGIFWERTKVGQ